MVLHLFRSLPQAKRTGMYRELKVPMRMSQDPRVTVGPVKSEAASITVTVLIITIVMMSLCPAPFCYDLSLILPEEWVEARVLY